MKIQTLLITQCILTLPLAIAQEDGALPPAPRTITSVVIPRAVQDGAARSAELIVLPEAVAITPPTSLEIVGADPFKDDDSTSRREQVSPQPAPSDGGIVAESEPFVGPLTPIVRDQVIEEPHALALLQSLRAQADTARAQVIERPLAPSLETLSFCYEEFSLPLEVMTGLQQEQLSDVALHEHVRKNLTAGSEQDGIHREIFAILRAKSGFPTSVRNYTTAASSEVKTNRQVGYHLDVTYDGSAGISLRFDLVNAIITGHTKEMREGKEVDLPVINEERIGTTVTLDLNTASLVSTMNRAGSDQDTDSGPRVILGFITASPVK